MESNLYKSVSNDIEKLNRKQRVKILNKINAMENIEHHNNGFEYNVLIHCDECNKIEPVWEKREFSCSKCGMDFCDDCAREKGKQYPTVSCCTCNTKFCGKCIENYIDITKRCKRCDDIFCEKCATEKMTNKFRCFECEEEHMKKIEYNKEISFPCSICDKDGEWHYSKGKIDTTSCDNCGRYVCSDCGKDKNLSCLTCKKLLCSKCKEKNISHDCILENTSPIKIDKLNK